MNSSLHIFIAVLLVVLSHQSLAAETYVENYNETVNAVRISDWDTLELLRTTKLKAVKIKAKSPEELIAQLEKAVHGFKEAGKIRFSFKRELWEKPLSDGTTGKMTANVWLELKDADAPTLLDLVRFVSELNQMTFSVTKNEIIFRPLIG